MTSDNPINKLCSWFHRLQISWLPPVVALVLFIAASALFMESVEKVVSLAQPLMGFLIALVLVGTFCWEWKIFGNPRNVPRFVAHIALGAALFFLINALFSENPEKDDLMGKILSASEWLSRKFIDSPLVTSVFDVLSSPGIAVLFLVTCLAFSIPRRDIALGFFVPAAALVMVFGLMRAGMDRPGYFLGGLALLALGCWFLFENRTKVVFWEAVQERLGNDPALRGDTELKIRFLHRFLVTRTPESGRACCGLVARALGIDPEDPEVRNVTVRVARQMIDEDKLAVLTYPDGVATLVPHPDLTASSESDGWTMVGRSVKVLIVGLVSLAWVLSPIDLIPDSIPIVGVIDDALIAILGASAVSQRFRLRRPKKETLAELD